MNITKKLIKGMKKMHKTRKLLAVMLTLLLFVTYAIPLNSVYAASSNVKTVSSTTGDNSSLAFDSNYGCKLNGTKISVKVLNRMNMKDMTGNAICELYWKASGNPKSGQVIAYGIISALKAGQGQILTYDVSKNPNGAKGVYIFKRSPNTDKFAPQEIEVSAIQDIDKSGPKDVSEIWSDVYTAAGITTPAPTQTPAPTVKPTPTGTPEPTQAPTATPEPTQAPTVTPEPTQAPTATPEPTQAPTATPEPTQAPTVTPEPTQAPTATPEPTLAPTATPAATPTPAPLKIEKVLPAEGYLQGGEIITILGSGFFNTTKVYFGEAEAQVNNYIDTNNLTVIAPPSSTAVAVDVSVENPDGQTSVLKLGYTYIEILASPAPTIISVSPDNGYTTGGDIITITGTNFVTGSKFTFGNLQGQLIYLADSTKALVISPSSETTGYVDVTVTNPDEQSATLDNGFNFIAPPPPPPPTISSISPDNGYITGGDAVMITGTNFKYNSTVVFGTVEVPITFWYSDTLISAITPAAPEGVVSVTVKNSDGQSATLDNAYTYKLPPPPPAPTVTAIDPNQSPLMGGGYADITGTNFQPQMKVYIGGKQAGLIYMYGSTKIQVSIPEGDALGLVDVKVVNPDGQEATLVDSFEYIPLIPTISSVSPNNGYTTGGDTIMINGSNFSTSSKVYIGDTQVPIIYLYGSGQISVQTPAVEQPMVVDIKVVNIDGTFAVLSSAFTYSAPPLPPAPTITQISLNTAATNAGGTIIIYGSNLSFSTKVYIGGVLAQNIFLYHSGMLCVMIPVVTNPGVVDVTVEDTYGQSATLSGGFTYTNP
jgi:hypothetical protein